MMDKILTPTKHDFPEDWKHENGMYEHNCGVCEKKFIAGKYRFICKMCWNKKTSEIMDS